MTDSAEASTGAHGKRKLYVACNACRFRKVKCDREPRLEQGHSACTNCESSSMECVLTVNPPKKRMGKRMKMLQEQQGSTQTASLGSSAASELPSNSTDDPHTSTTASITDSLGMSPGFSTLLEAVSQQDSSLLEPESLLPSATDGTATATSGVVDDVSTYMDRPQSHSSILQNGIFATLSSSNAETLHFSTGITPSNEQRASLHRFSDASITSTHSVSPAATGPTPKSATAPSDPSSPENISSNAAFFSSAVTEGARSNGLKRRNPFDKPSRNNPSGQVGFVGGLLGIVSLDKHLLDACVRAYFDSTGQCIGFIRPEWFWPRYNAFFQRYNGFATAISDTDPQPLSELLLVAVACRGSGATHFANRFELQKDLYQHYCRLIKDRDRLVRDGFDALESVVLMVEHSDGLVKSIPDPMSSRGVFDVDVVSHEGMIRLMMKLELHLEKPFGTRLEGRDMVRQRILFWTIYVYDAIRSEAGRTLPLIQDDDISLSRTLASVAVTSADAMRMLFRDHFVDLANICRHVARKIQSPRVQGFGIDPQDVLDVLDDLKAWHDGLSSLFMWDWNDMLHITGPTDPEDQTRRTFLIFLFLGQWITIDYAVEEIGFSSTCDAKLKEQVIRRLEHEVDITLDRQVLVCDHGTLFGIIRLHPGMMKSWTVTWAMWCLKRMQTIVASESQGRLASAKANQAFQRYQSAVLCFINATATCDSAQDTPTTVQDLMSALRKVTEAWQSAKLTFESVGSQSL